MKCCHVGLPTKIMPSVVKMVKATSLIAVVIKYDEKITAVIKVKNEHSQKSV